MGFLILVRWYLYIESGPRPQDGSLSAYDMHRLAYSMVLAGVMALNRDQGISNNRADSFIVRESDTTRVYNVTYIKVNKPQYLITLDKTAHRGPVGFIVESAASSPLADNPHSTGYNIQPPLAS